MTGTASEKSVRFERVTGTVGAIVHGVRLGGTAHSTAADTLRRALHEYGVLFFEFDHAVSADEFAAFGSLLHGAFGYPEAIGYTLYYTTTYIFAGLAVWLALQVGEFNIGGEGQIYLGGLGAGLVCIALDGAPSMIVIPTACEIGRAHV